MDEEKERQKEIREKLESERLDPDEFEEYPPSHEATDGRSERPAYADLRFADSFGKARASAGREELADLL